MARPFAPALLAADPAALRLLPDGFRHASARAAAVAAAAARGVAPGLLAALAAQQARLPSDSARDEALERLGRPGAVAVVTGQQVGLFGGPLYALYKAAAAVRTAQALQAETGAPAVAVFWLQTEDHDLHEIDHAFVPGDAEPLRLTARPADAVADAPRDAADAAARRPVGAAPLADAVGAAIDAFADAVGGLPHAERTVALLRACYRPGAGWAEAFAALFAEVFAGTGLLLLNPRDPAIAALTAPLHARCLDEAAPIAAILQTRSKALEAAGFAPQVHVRPEAPLAFFAPDEVADGSRGAPRYRLEPRGADQFALIGDPAGRVVDRAALYRALAERPIALSTSALLRPLLQDTLLPTAAYLGGPGEIAYFAQLPPLYAHLGVAMPLIVPRARFRLLDPRSRGLLARLGLPLAQVLGDETALRATLAERAAGDGFPSPEATEAALLADVLPGLDALGETMARLDPNLQRTAERAGAQVRDTVGKLVQRYAAALGRRDADAWQRVVRLRALQAPGGVPQERCFCVAWALAWLGPTAAQTIIAETAPFSGELQELQA
ncbi:MAG: bacillithiol biosynthesis cysteine-adding enzyme BshC [Pseudomonadota bacterium]